MGEYDFDWPVRVNLGVGLVRSVGNVHEAADCLRFWWPADRCRARYLDAVKACLEALDGQRSAGDVERAFRAAVADAGISDEGPRRR